MTETLKEQTLKKINTWIDTKVPVHTRAEYRELLHQKEAVMIQLYNLHVSYEELGKAYQELQKNTVQNWGLRVPNFKVEGEAYNMVSDYATMYRINLKSEAMTIAYRHDNQEKFIPSLVLDAFHDHFFGEVAPKIWQSIEGQLMKNVAKEDLVGQGQIKRLVRKPF